MDNFFLYIKVFFIENDIFSHKEKNASTLNLNILGAMPCHVSGVTEKTEEQVSWDFREL